MPWKKSFDEEAALEAAMQVFWGKGFEAASITDLIEGTGVNRGSLYNAFGGKKPLFIKALNKYNRDRRQTRLEQLEALGDPKQAIFQFFDLAVADTIADEHRKGCFLINTSLELPSHDAEVNQIVAESLRTIEVFFEGNIEKGQLSGEIPANIQPEAVAKTLLGLLVGIRVLSRGVYTQPALQTIADEAKQLIS